MSRVVLGGVSEVSSMTRSPTVLDVVLVLRRSCLHEDAPGKSWSALRDHVIFYLSYCTQCHFHDVDYW